MLRPAIFRPTRSAGRPVARWALGLIACTLATSAPQAASAQIRIASSGNSAFTVKVMTWWEIPFRSVVRQRYDFSCGSAALATLLTYHYGRPTNETMTFSAMWDRGDQESIRKSGFSMLDMRNYLNGIGLRADGFRFDTDDLRKVRRPGIALLNLKGYKHFVVIKGVTDNEVLVGDPMLGLKSYPMDEFARYWNGIFLAIIEAPDKRRPVFNLASDWGPWSRAPIDSHRGNDSIERLTSFLPPTYQISPQILIDVRPR